MNWIILVLLAALMNSFRDFFTKRALNNMHSKQMLAITGLFISIICLIDYKNINLHLSLITWIFLITKIIILTVAWYLFYHAMRKMPLSSISPLKNFTPAILVVLSFLILSEKVSIINLVGIFILVISTYLLQIHDYKDIFHPFKILNNKYLIHILISLILFSLCAILDKILIESMSSTSLVFTNYLGMSIIIIIDLIILNHGKELINNIKKSSKLIIPIAIAGAVGDTFYFIAVAQPEALIALIIPIKRMSTLLDTIMGGQFFHEDHIINKSIICIIMIGGAVLVTL